MRPCHGFFLLFLFLRRGTAGFAREGGICGEEEKGLMKRYNIITYLQPISG